MLIPAEQLAATKGPKPEKHLRTQRWTCHVRKCRNALGLTMRRMESE